MSNCCMTDVTLTFTIGALIAQAMFSVFFNVYNRHKLRRDTKHVRPYSTNHVGIVYNCTPLSL